MSSAKYLMWFGKILMIILKILSKKTYTLTTAREPTWKELTVFFYDMMYKDDQIWFGEILCLL